MFKKSNNWFNFDRLCFLLLTGIDIVFSHHLLLWNSQCICSKLRVDLDSERAGGIWYRRCPAVVSLDLLEIRSSLLFQKGLSIALSQKLILSNLATLKFCKDFQLTIYCYARLNYYKHIKYFTDFSFLHKSFSLYFSLILCTLLIV